MSVTKLRDKKLGKWKQHRWLVLKMDKQTKKDTEEERFELNPNVWVHLLK